MMRYDGPSADLDRTLMALADPIRRRILQRLAASNARVTDVAAEFSISLNSVSKHIRLLERARLIERNVSGREHILRFRPEPLSKAQQWITAQQAFWASRLEALDDLLTAEDAARESPRPKEKKHVRKR
jgi:DNA-binding transcriptional ArsR family regulator